MNEPRRACHVPSSVDGAKTAANLYKVGAESLSFYSDPIHFSDPIHLGFYSDPIHLEFAS